MGIIKKYRLQIIITLSLFFASLVLFSLGQNSNEGVVEVKSNTWWEVQSIDTVKYSRDVAREKLDDPSFVKVVDEQVSVIANTGATHIAISTPYDAEFTPFLKLWVNTARKYGLKVWFRGNFSGWEGWFNYAPIGANDHMEKTEQFIFSSKSLFEDGDIFTSCTECENGSLGDPRYEINVEDYRIFLIAEYNIAKNTFAKIGKTVISNYYPMNGDVARLVMDRETTDALDGVIVVDHYVGSVTQLSADIKALGESSGGRVVLGEFGAPIPDIHGIMNEQQQAKWVGEALSELSKNENLIGVNYWTSYGGSTQLWGSSGPREAVNEISNYYSPDIIDARIVNELGKPVRNAVINAGIKSGKVSKNGMFKILIIPSIYYIEVKAEGYKDRKLQIEELDGVFEVVLEKEKESIIFKLQKLLIK